MRKNLKKSLAAVLSLVLLLSTFSVGVSALTVGTKYSWTETRTDIHYDWGNYKTANGEYHSAWGQLVLRNLTSDGKPVYCLQAHKATNGSAATTVELKNTDAWKKELSPAAKQGITWASIYGYSNYSYGYSAEVAQVATQMLIWEWQTNNRRSISSDASKSITEHLSGNYLKCYNAIVNACRNRNNKPKFNPSTVNLTGVGKDNGVWITDSTGQAKNFTLTDWPDGIGAKWDSTHTKLKIYATEAKAIKGTLLFTKECSNIGSAMCLTGANQTMLYGSVSDPVTTNISVTLSTGSLTIKKTCEWGSCWQKSFLITGPNGYKNQVWILAKHLNDSQGRTAALTLTDLAAGTYTVSEVGRDSAESSYKQTVGNQSRSVNAPAGGTVTTSFVNTPKDGHVKVMKTSTDGKVEGINIRIYGKDYNNADYDKTFTTDGEGLITQDIAPGNYTAEEVFTTDMDTEYYKPDPVDFNVEPNKTSTVSFENVVKNKRIKIIKKDENGNLLDGCLFGIFSDEDCTVKATDYYGNEIPLISGNKYSPFLKPGTYWVQEQSCPSDYVLDDTPKKVVATDSSKLYQVEFVNNFKSQRIWFYKVAENGGYINSNNQRSVAFKLTFTRQSDGSTWNTILATHDGTLNGSYDSDSTLGPYESVGLAKNMIFGYRSSSISVSEDSFFRPGETYTVDESLTSTADPNRVYRLIENQEFTIPNDDSWKQGIAIKFENYEKKGNVEIHKSADDGIIEGVMFRLHGTSDNGIAVDETALTDENGVAKFENLPLGTYDIDEIETEVRYHGFETKSVDVTEDGKTYTVSADNKLKYANVEIHKNSEDGVLKDFTFTLQNTATGESLTAVTDENGIAKFEKLPIYASDNTPITYVVSEISAPVRYKLVDDESFTLVDYESDDDTQRLTVDVINTLKKSPISIFKSASDGVIEGVQFCIMSTATFESDYYTTAADGKITSKDYPIYDEKGEKIYYVISEVNIDGRYLPTQSQTITLEEDAPTEVVFSNIVKKGNLELHKVDSETGELLSGAEFEVYKDVDGDKKYTAGVDTLYDRKPSETEKGVYQLKDIVYGNYLVREIKAPAGFYLDDNYYSFSIVTDGATETVETVSGGFGNEPIKGTIKLIKADTENKDTLISGAEFTVYKDVDGDKKYTAGVDTVAGVMSETEKGHYEYSGLRAADYLVKETAAPEGYVCDEKYYPFKVDGTGDYTTGSDE